MAPIAFVSSFQGAPVRPNRSETIICNSRQHVCKFRAKSRRYRVYMNIRDEPEGNSIPAKQASRSQRIIGIVGKSRNTSETKAKVDSTSAGGLFGMRANAYWDSMGAIPLFFAGFGIVALGIKMLKVKSGELRSGPSGINKVTIPKSVITTVEEEAELHVFKCGGCGYEMYPARGREFKFFPDTFKCPLCGTPKSEFWDLNDPDDPRNQEEDEEEDEDEVQADDDPGSSGAAAKNPQEPVDGGGETESTITNRAETDSST